MASSQRRRHLTDEEKQALYDLFPYMNATQAARKARCNVTTARLHYRTWKLANTPTTKAAMQGHAPEHDMTHTVPEPYVVKGVSSYYGPDGELRGQWVKSALREDKAAEAIREFTEWLAANGAQGLAPLTTPPEHTDDALLSVYPLPEPHLGMFSWQDETGESYDLDIAEKLVTGAVDRLVASAAPSRRALLLNIGDFTHVDDSRAETPAHHHRLDVDTRFPKVAQVALRTLLHCIRRLLEKHAEVDVWTIPGNHDPHVSFMLALALDAYFSAEPRVTVDLSPSMYRFMRFGSVLIGAHHGHGAKPEKLPLLMAADRPEDWGQTRHRYWWTGHIHHLTKLRDEYGGVVVESIRSIAAKDAHHASKGYRSGRDMNVVTYHRDFGEIQRTRCDIAML